MYGLNLPVMSSPISKSSAGGEQVVTAPALPEDSRAEWYFESWHWLPDVGEIDNTTRV